MTEILGMHPRWDYPRAMERPPRAAPPRDEAAEAAALAGPQMFDCPRLPGKPRISERQCLINQERAAVGGFPSFCVDCPEGREIKARHPEGTGVKVRPRALDGFINKPQELKLAREKQRTAVPTPDVVCHTLTNPTSNEVEKINLRAEKEAESMGSPGRETTTAEPAEMGEAAPRKPVSELEKPPGRGSALISTPEPPRCKKHPNEVQFRSKKGVYLGRCKLCMPNPWAFRKSGGPQPGVEVAQRPAANQPEKINTAPAPVDGDWRRLLLAKFPAFSPDWPEEVQKSWLDGFGKMADLLMAEKCGGGG